ncbi:MAG: redoxin domain-containing protein [Actinomycetia bacterium]|nr:redoxin domain-containing protein [Actinomycetes bacterium]MCP4223132.1 redoxin domain-containing protein [Actinomycetes bacterium]MCP5032630.1 redoxin domain-containing protein [Actinomycetes bacterium]
MQAPPRPRIGDPAPNITLTHEDGQSWRLSDHGGRYTILIFHRHIH